MGQLGEIVPRPPMSFPSWLIWVQVAATIGRSGLWTQMGNASTIRRNRDREHQPATRTRRPSGEGRQLQQGEPPPSQSTACAI